MFNFLDFIPGVEAAIHPLIHRGVVSSESSTFGDQAHTRELFIAGDVVAQKRFFLYQNTPNSRLQPMF